MVSLFLKLVPIVPSLILEIAFLALSFFYHDEILEDIEPPRGIGYT